MGGKPNQHRGELLTALAKLWGHAECELNHTSAFELLIATILSAQSTDKRVNMVTPVLFEHYPSPKSLANANLDEVEEIIRSTGFYRQKAKNIVKTAAILESEHKGQVPKTLEELTALPGVARKTANVVLGEFYGIQSGVVVDTHVKRLAGRLGLSSESTPAKIEKDLMAGFPRQEWTNLAQRLIWHGRRVCHAKKPDCSNCQLAPLCPSEEVT